MSTSITDDHVLRVRVADHAVVGPHGRRGRRPSVRSGTTRRGSRPRSRSSAPSSRRSRVRYCSRSVPRWPRRAFSKIANVSHAWKTSCATSTGSGGDSHGNGRFSAGLNEYGARSPRFLYARWVASASALDDQREVLLAREHPRRASRSRAAGPSCRRCPSSSAASGRRRAGRRGAAPRRRTATSGSTRGCMPSMARRSRRAGPRRRRPRARRAPTCRAARARPPGRRRRDATCAARRR